MSDFTEANRKYFDQMAVSYQGRFANVMRTLTEETLNNRSWISERWTDSATGKGHDISMLEYACGPGLISMALAPFLTRVVGFDVADNMVDEFNRNASSLGVAAVPANVQGYKADLLAETPPAEFSGPEYHDFDLVAVSMALHHFEHPDRALQRLAARLNKGGVFYIIDFVPHSGNAHGHGHSHGHAHGGGHAQGGGREHEHKRGHEHKEGQGHEHEHESGRGHDQGHGQESGHGHDHDQGHSHGRGHWHEHGKAEFGDAAHTVKTHGFSREDMQKLFEGAGLNVGFDYKELPEPLVFHKEDLPFSKKAFLARVQRG